MNILSPGDPPPTTVVEALTRAGVSFRTAVAMPGWKAAEVLALLPIENSNDPLDQVRGRRQEAW